jgi:hypothetical protein
MHRLDSSSGIVLVLSTLALVSACGGYMIPDYQPIKTRMAHYHPFS